MLLGSVGLLLTPPVKMQRLILTLLIALHIGCHLTDGARDESAVKARTAIEYVERVRNSPCTGGTEEVLPVEFDHAQWSSLAEVAMRMSNLLTKIIVQNENRLDNVSDEFLFNLVRNNVDGDSYIFGSAIAVEEYVYSRYRIFCPYSYKKSRIYAHDISLNYNYLDPSTEWYHVLRVKNWTTAYVSTNYVTYREKDAHSKDGQIVLKQPMARLKDGHWTAPYYDCGGGDIWMVTYSSPIFALVNNTPEFKGIGTIDIELTNIDINQCDAGGVEDSTGSVDVFRGTHHCQRTTRCQPIIGRGFVPGAYKCICENGFYFSDTNLPDAEKYFNGSLLETHFLEQDLNASAEFLAQFHCLQCAEGCDTCEDFSPCLFAPNLALRVTLLVLSSFTVLWIGATSFLVHAFKDKTAVRSASPMFMHIMCAGCVLMCVPMFVKFPEPSDLTCFLAPWPQHVGFGMAYGALLLKTWRIATIFRVKSARRLNLSDKILAQRFVPVLAMPLAYMAVWGATSRPLVTWRNTINGLKFKDCTNDWWHRGAFMGEAVFLLWGAYLCFVVRKAPSEFNESKYITWAIYNNILLGSFTLVARDFIAADQGPDLIYVIDFVYVQICVTGLLCLIFLPKLYQVFRLRRQADETNCNTAASGLGTTTTMTFDQRNPDNGTDTVDVAVQVDLVTPEQVDPACTSTDSVLPSRPYSSKVYPA